MSILNYFLTVIALALLTTVVNAQSGGDNLKHFQSNGLSFDSPDDWKVTDSSTEDVKFVTIASQDAVVQMAVIARLINDQGCDFQAAGKKITDALVERVADQIHAAHPLQIFPLKTQVGSREIDGVGLRGSTKNGLTGEVYWYRLNLRLVNLVYLRPGNEARGELAWQALRKTVQLESPIFYAAAVNAGVPADPNVLNGRAVHLEQPFYPQIARQAHATGTVVVKIVVDEDGKVIFAEAVTGHPLLKGVSVTAAKQSKFPQTKLCGEPVRVTGVVQYSFHLQ